MPPKALAYLYYGKPPEWVVYQRRTFSVERCEVGFKVTEMLLLSKSEGWVVGRSKTRATMEEIEKEIPAGYGQITRSTERYTAGKEIIWYRDSDHIT